MRMLVFLILIFSLYYVKEAVATPDPKNPYGSGLRVNLNSEGSYYFRIITWHQIWLDMKKKEVALDRDKLTATPLIRRSRLLLFAQLSDRFLILTHIGLNNLTPDCLDPIGSSSQTQLFMHDAWIEFKVFDQLFIGGGLHYWNGISRLNSQSTLNFLPIDNPRFAWPTIGTSDQFGRHIGLYAKGKIGKLDYRFAWNNPILNSLDVKANLNATTNSAVYSGRRDLGLEASHIYSGYVNYQFLEKESNKLPYFVGTYLGKKKVWNIGAGFYAHPSGSVILSDSDSTDLIGQNVLIWAVDQFLELPIGGSTSVTAYMSYQNTDYGKNYQLNRTSDCIFTGNTIYLQAGILLSSKNTGAWQPYFTISRKHIDLYDKSFSDKGVGINYLLEDHHAKISLEYRRIGSAVSSTKGQLILQAVVFL